MDVEPLLDAALPILLSGLNELQGDAMDQARVALEGGAAAELRISVRDGIPAIVLGLSGIDGDFCELGRMTIEGTH